MGWPDGALRIMPNWELHMFQGPGGIPGVTFPLNVFLPIIILPVATFTVVLMLPFIEAFITGDKRDHHLLQRPRNAPTRTALMVALMTFYGVLWLAGGNDVLADRFHVSLYATTWFFRGAVIIGPILTYIVTKRICVALQRGDAAQLDHGVESGIIKMMPSGEFVEVHEPVKDEAEAVLLAKSKPLALESAEADENGVPSPSARGPLGRARKALNNAFTTDDIEMGNGHANGDGGHPEVEGGDHKELSRG
jgi:ubiquinol-cytochrome c reductase cytochrome b subunit